jgi:hypothetical protein
MKYRRTNKFIFSYLYEDGVSIMAVPVKRCACSLQRSMAFLEIVVQHTSCHKEETIYCPCKVWKNNVMFKDREVICKHL